MFTVVNSAECASCPVPVASRSTRKAMRIACSLLPPPSPMPANLTHESDRNQTEKGEKSNYFWREAMCVVCLSRDPKLAVHFNWTRN